MPQLRQPASLFNLALPVTALRIRNRCDAILRSYEDVTQTPFQDHITAFNRYMRNEVPHSVLKSIIQNQNLAVFIYHDVRRLRVQENTLRNTPIHNHLITNVFPMLGSVTVLDLSKVEGSLDLYKGVSLHCPQLEVIVINTSPGIRSYAFFEAEFSIWLLYLTKCKRLKVIRNHVPFGYNNFVNPDLQNAIVPCVLKQLPELKEFVCDLSSTLEMKRMRQSFYKITHFIINSGGFFESAEGIQWLNVHCPLVDKVNWEVSNVTDQVAAFQALALTELKIKTLVFFCLTPVLGEAMKLFLTNKGMFIEYLYLSFEDQASALSYDNILLISQCCPGLRRLSLDGDWYNKRALTPSQRQTKCMFKKLEHFFFDFYNSYAAVISRVLDEVFNLEELRCNCDIDRVVEFLNIIKGMRNSLTRLTELRVVVFGGSESLGSEFVLQLVPIAMRWTNIRRVAMYLTDCILSPEAKQYLKVTKSQAKLNNLDVILSVVGLEGDINVVDGEDVDEDVEGEQEGVNELL